MANDFNFVAALFGVLSALTAGFFVTTGSSDMIALATFFSIIAFVAINQVNRRTRISGRTRKMKAVLINSNIFYEIVLLLALLSLPEIPKEASLIVLATVAFSEMLRLEAVNRVDSGIDSYMGRNARVILIIASMAGYLFNPVLVFYGAVAVFLAAALDSLNILGQLYRSFGKV